MFRRWLARRLFGISFWLFGLGMRLLGFTLDTTTATRIDTLKNETQEHLSV